MKFFSLTILLLACVSAFGEPDDFFEHHTSCSARLDELLELTAANDLGIAVRLDRFDGGRTQSVSRVYVGPDTDLPLVVQQFSFLIGLRSITAVSKEILNQRIAAALVDGRGILIHGERHSLSVRFVNHMGIQLAVLSTSMATEVPPNLLHRFLTKFTRRPRRE